MNTWKIPYRTVVTNCIFDEGDSWTKILGTSRDQYMGISGQLGTTRYIYPSDKENMALEDT